MNDEIRAVFENDWVSLLLGDSYETLCNLPSASVDCCVTSPPYYGLRDYGVDGQLGLEKSPAEYVEALAAVFDEVKRVLTPDGTLWLNIGDSYSGGDRGTYDIDGGKTRARGLSSDRPLSDRPGKNLLMIPSRVALALQDAGWTLRNDIIWWKRNAMPSSVRDRLTNRYEHLFLLTPGPSYWFDLDAIREPLDHPEALDGTRIIGGKNKGTQGGIGATERMRGSSAYGATAYPDGMPPQRNMGATGRRHDDSWHAHPKGKNPGDVWDMVTRPYREAHFATFPIDLPMRCIKAGCKPGGTVLDPFSGSGTTGAAAVALGRFYVGIDINPEYHELAARRFAQSPLPFGVTA